MKLYIIKRDDGKYYKFNPQTGVRFVNKIQDSEMYDTINRANFAKNFLIEHCGRYDINTNNIKVVQIEIKECEDE